MPNSESAAALAGTCTVSVFQAPACSPEAACQLPVQAQLPLAPCSTYGCTEEITFPAGIQTWNVISLPAGMPGERRRATPLPEPERLTLSERVPANARSVELETLVALAVGAKFWVELSKL